MTREAYISELRRHLSRLPDSEVKEIIAEYEDHFRAGKADGKTDERICESLGTPKAVAQEFQITNLVAKAEVSHGVVQKSEVLLRMLVAFLILAPLNFFLLIGPFVVLVVCLIVGWVMPLAVMAGGVALLALLFHGTGPLAFLTGASVFFMFTGSVGLAILGALIMFVVTKGVLTLLVRYVKWNLNFITARKA